MTIATNPPSHQSYSSKKPERLDLIIKQLRTNSLHTLRGLIDSKNDEIEWHTIREKIGTLDSSTSKIGHGLAEKMQAWLSESTVKRTTTVLDVLDRVDETLKEGISVLSGCAMHLLLHPINSLTAMV